MGNKEIACLLIIGLVALVACQPQVALVEVTRIVVVSSAERPVAVTRLVPQEVTRIVPQELDQELVVDVTKAPLGSAERPVQLLFAPTVDTAVIAARGATLAQALTAATGRVYEVGLLDSEQHVVELMCAAPADTVGFLSAMSYVVAHERCGVQPANVAIHGDDLTWQTGMIVVRRDGDMTSLADLAGRRWAVPDTNSVSGFLSFQAMLADAGVEVGEIVEVPGDSSAVLAVYNGEADFATASYVPPILPYDERSWQYGVDDPEIWRRLDIAPRRSPIGYVLVNGEPEAGGYRVRDARAGIFDTTPEIFNETSILALSPPIPNETVAFGANFPFGLSRQVMAALLDFANSEACDASICSADFYGWAGLAPAEDASYDSLRFLIETLGLSNDEVWALSRDT